MEIFEKIMKLNILESLEYLDLGYNGLDDDGNKNKFASARNILRENLREFKIDEYHYVQIMSLE